MKNNTKLILISILFPLLASCSYGASSIVKRSHFLDFYEDEVGGLKTQKNHSFTLGDNINISTVETSDDKIINEKFILQSFGYEGWTMGDDYKDGDPLSYSITTKVEDLDGEQLELLTKSGLFQFESSLLEDPDTNKKIISSKYMFSEAESEKHGSLENFRGSEKGYLDYSLSAYYSKQDIFGYQNGKEILEQTIEDHYIEKNHESLINSLLPDGTKRKFKLIETLSFSYTIVDNVLDDEKSYSLSYSNVVNTTVNDQKYDGNTKISGSITVSEEKEKASFSEISTPTSKNPNDSKTNKVQVQDYDPLSGQYVDNEELSKDEKVEGWTFDLLSMFIEKCTRDQLFNEFKQSSRLESALTTINDFYRGLFADFENEFYYTSSKEEEIIQSGRTYAYRYKIDDTHVRQYLFLDGKNKEESSSLSKVSDFFLKSASEAILIKETTLII